MGHAQAESTIRMSGSSITKLKTSRSLARSAKAHALHSFCNISTSGKSFGRLVGAQIHSQIHSPMHVAHKTRVREPIADLRRLPTRSGQPFYMSMMSVRRLARQLWIGNVGPLFKRRLTVRYPSNTCGVSCTTSRFARGNLGSRCRRRTSARKSSKAWPKARCIASAT